MGICDEHNLQNQIHFTEIQDKACNVFSQSIVVLQLIFLMCHSHSYWQSKLHSCFRLQDRAQLSVFWFLNHYIQSALHSCPVVPAYIHPLSN